jgi:hypothetical protein
MPDNPISPDSMKKGVASIQKPTEPLRLGHSEERLPGSGYSPKNLCFYEHVSPKSIMIGGRVVATGEVIAITSEKEIPSKFSLQPDYLSTSRASELIKGKFGREHPGPATVSIRRPDVEDVLKSYGFQPKSLMGNRMTVAPPEAVKQKAGAF